MWISCGKSKRKVAILLELTLREFTGKLEDTLLCFSPNQDFYEYYIPTKKEETKAETRVFAAHAHKNRKKGALPAPEKETRALSGLVFLCCHVSIVCAKKTT